jgi:iron complex outermembrane receptor protein
MNYIEVTGRKRASVVKTAVRAEILNGENMNDFRLVSAAILSTLFLSSAALSQQPASSGGSEATDQLGEIIVTAQKREQSLIDIPAAITAITGTTVRDLNVSSFPAIAEEIPSFVVTYERGENTTPSFNLRGIQGDNLGSRLNESSVAIYTDGVYLGDENMLNGLVFDVQRVEVLRGPQGTLFGRNTTGGLVNFISETPTKELSGYGSVLYGSDNAVTLEGAVSGAVSDTIRARIAGMWDRNDGYYRNSNEAAGQDGVSSKLGAKDVYGFRGIIDADVDDQTLLRFIVFYSKSDSQTTPPYLLGTLKPGTVGPGPYTRAQQCTTRQIFAGQCISQAQIFGALPNGGDQSGVGTTVLTPQQLRAVGEGEGITGELTHHMDWATLTSIANFTTNEFWQGFEAGRASPSFDLDIEPSVYATRDNTAHQWSEELRLDGSTSLFDWVGGAFYYDDKKYNATLIGVNAYQIGDTTIASVDSHSYALFGQLDNHLSDQWTIETGARFTGNIRDLTVAETYNSFSPATTFQDIHAYMQAHDLPTESDTRDWTGKLGLTWKPSADDSYYGSVSRGIKGVGFNAGFIPTNTPAANAALAGPVGEEQLLSYEIGAKNRLFDRTLSINSAIFFYDYKNKQVSLPIFDPSTNTASFNFINVGTVHVWGAETEIHYRPDKHWDLSLSAGYVGNEITKSGVVTPDNFGVLVSLQGKQLIQTPQWTFNTILAYHVPTHNLGVFTLQNEEHGIASQNFSIVNDPLADEPAYVLTNFRILWESPQGIYNAQAYVTNAFSKNYALDVLDSVTAEGGKLVLTEGEPRLWGVKLGMRF